MRFIRNQQTNKITVLVNTPTGEQKFPLDTDDEALAREMCKAANLEVVEVAAQANVLSHEFIRKLAPVGGVRFCDAYREWDKWYGENCTSILNHYCIGVKIKHFAKRHRLWSALITKVTTEHVSAWVNAEDGVKLPTRRNRLHSINVFFKFCCGSNRRYCYSNPAEEVRVKIRNLTHAQIEPNPKHVFTDEEYNKVIWFLSAKVTYLENRPATNNGRLHKLNLYRFWLCATMIGRTTALRLGDICLLEQASLVEPNKLKVWTRKKNVLVEHILTPDVAKELALWRNKGRQYFFARQAKLRLHPERRKALSAQFKKICRSAGMGHHHFHELRATAATLLNRSGFSREAIAATLGHTSLSSQKAYILEESK